MKFNEKITRLSKGILALAVSLVSATAFSTSAYASDQKVSPGSMCDAPNQIQGINLSKTSLGRAVNTSTSATIFYVVCPIVRDNVNSNFNPPSVQIRVSNLNNVTTTCWFEALNSNNDSYYDINSGSFAGAGAFTLNIPLSKLTLGGTPYQIECALPPGSSILRYNIVEAD